MCGFKRKINIFHPGGGQGYSLQYSCMENPMDSRVWWAIVHRVTKRPEMTEVT